MHTHDDTHQSTPSPVQQPRKGLFGAVGRAFGSIFRSNSTRSIATSTSLQDVRAELDDYNRPSPHHSRLTKSKTSRNLAPAAAPSASPSASTHLPPPVARHQRALPASSSLSALSSYPSAVGAAQPRSTSRSAHATLNLATPSSSRANSPAVSTAASYTRHNLNPNRSPSPTRNTLATSISTFNLTNLGGQPPAPSHVSTTTTTYGLQSRSPFTSNRPPPSITRSASVSSFQGQGDHQRRPPNLFPYTSTLPRGGSPLSTSQSVSSNLGGGLQQKRSYTALSATATPLRGVGVATRSRVASPLNPYASSSSTLGFELQGGAERARKKQLVWDPEMGLVSREALAREKEL